MRAKADNPDLAGIPKLHTPLRHDVQLYVQVYDVLYDMISGGQLKPGDLIPGECALAQHFGVSRGTVRQAIQYLEEDGLLTKHQGRGSEVVDRSKRNHAGLQNYTDMCREFCTVPISRVEAKWIISGAGHWLSEQLQLPKGALTINFDLIYYREDEAVALAQRLIPATWLERCSVDPNSVEEMRAFAIDQVPKLVTDSRAEITIHTEVIPEISRSGEIPCFSISEIASDGEGRPVGHFKNYLRSDCYRLYLERHRGPR